MKSKATIITSSILAVSLVVTAVVLAKIKQNETTVGPPVGASDLSTPNPNLTLVQGELLSSFPEMPVYPSAAIVSSSMENISDKEVLYEATWSVSGDNLISEMSDWYSGELISDGWTKTDNSNGSELSQKLSFTKGGDVLNLTIAKGDRASRFRINIKASILVRQ
jgi:hypothetical protein